MNAIFDWLALVDSLQCIRGYDYSIGGILLQPSSQPMSQRQEHQYTTLLKNSIIKRAAYEEDGLKVMAFNPISRSSRELKFTIQELVQEDRVTSILKANLSGPDVFLIAMGSSTNSLTCYVS